MYILPEGVIITAATQVGRFTIAQVRDRQGIKGTGVSRCSFLDAPDTALGETKAIGRALCALKRKQDHKKIHNVFMG